jgi:prepilin-type N-terminal cleavage/methylation domain-containing protein
MRKDAGFTLLELLTVIAIAGVLAAIAVPNFLSYQYNSRLKGALSTLRGDLVGARMLAIKSGFEYQVAFSSGGYLIQQGNLSLNSTSYTTEVTRNFADEYPGVTASVTPSAPVFSPKGTVAAAPVIITLQNAQRTRTITIHMAGKIKEN